MRKTTKLTIMWLYTVLGLIAMYLVCVKTTTAPEHWYLVSMKSVWIGGTALLTGMWLTYLLRKDKSGVQK